MAAVSSVQLFVGLQAGCRNRETATEPAGVNLQPLANGRSPGDCRALLDKLQPQQRAAPAVAVNRSLLGAGKRVSAPRLRRSRIDSVRSTPLAAGAFRYRCQRRRGRQWLAAGAWRCRHSADSHPEAP